MIDTDPDALAEQVYELAFTHPHNGPPFLFAFTADEARRVELAGDPYDALERMIPPTGTVALALAATGVAYHIDTGDTAGPVRLVHVVHRDGRTAHRQSLDYGPPQSDPRATGRMVATLHRLIERTPE